MMSTRACLSRRCPSGPTPGRMRCRLYRVSSSGVSGGASRCRCTPGIYKARGGCRAARSHVGALFLVAVGERERSFLIGWAFETLLERGGWCDDVADAIARNEAFTGETAEDQRDRFACGSDHLTEEAILTGAEDDLP